MAPVKVVKPANSLEEALGFYGSYHQNKINQLIHVIFVPCIVFTAMVIFNYFSADFVLGKHFYPLDWLGFKTHQIAALQFINNNLILGGGLALYLALSIYYLSLTFVPAITYITLLTGLLLGSGYFFTHTAHAWQYALALHVFSWYMQIHPGHGIFEKRSAALTDNFIKGVALGPLFAWYEVLFFFGWNPTLKHKIEDLAQYNIAVWKESLKNGKAK